MHKDSLLQTRVKSELKQAADELFCSMGLTTSDAIRIFITECVAKQSFPFEITPSTKKSTGKDFGILNPYASPMKRAKERDAWISALVSAPEMMIGDGLIGDTNIEGDRTYNLSDDERDEFQGSDDVNRGFAFDNELFAGLVNDEPLRGNARPAETEGESGKRNAANAVAVSGKRNAAADTVSGERSSACAQYDSEERNAAAADTATMSAESITGKRISAGSTGTAGAQRAGSGAATRAWGTSAATKASSAGAGTGTGVGAGATAQHIAKQHNNPGKHKIADEQDNPPAPHKTRSSRNSASHAKTAPHANANTEHKAHSPHVLKKPLLGENYHAYKEK